jgi:hypothetical protein
MDGLARLAWLVWAWSPLPLLNVSDRNVIFHVNQIRVIRDMERAQEPLAGTLLGFNYLMRGDTHRGLNYLRPQERRWRGDPEKDFSRLATTYHHQQGPAGVVMERLNWFPGPQNTFWADVRQPTSIVGLGGDVCSQLVNAWSEPPFATVGMYVGEMASYARPFQYADFFDMDPEIVKLSLPPRGRPSYFNYLQDALDRGATVRVFQGEERPTLQKEGPEGFYHIMLVEVATRDRLEAISVNLLTREGMAACLEKLAPQGVLCLHTSHRYLDLVPVVTDVARSLGLALRVGRDGGRRLNAEGKEIEPRGLFASEHIIIARDEKYLPPVTENPQPGGLTWHTPAANGKHVWTDESWHSLRGLMRSDPGVDRLRRKAQDAENRAFKLLHRLGINPTFRWRWLNVDSRIHFVFERLSWLGVTLREAANQRAEALAH